jgi:uncharacterized membrane protein YfcA
MELAGHDVGVYALVLGAGVVAGFLNTLAGGGTLFSLPVLMLLGLPAEVANGTARLSIVTQSASGAWAFHREGKLPMRSLGPVVVPSVLGAAAGAGVAAWAPGEILEPLILGTLITMAIVMVVKPGWVAPETTEEARDPMRHLPSIVGLFGAGFYGGFVQAGVGFVLLAVLGGIVRYDVVRANALKLACTLLFSLPAIVLFALADRIAWIPGVVLALGTIVGAQIGVRFAMKLSAKTLRWVILVMVVASCVAAFFDL